MLAALIAVRREPHYCIALPFLPLFPFLHSPNSDLASEVPTSGAFAVSVACCCRCARIYSSEGCASKAAMALSMFTAAE